MPDDIRITGGDQLAALGARLKAAGEGGLRRELLGGIRTGVKPLIQDVRVVAREVLPHHGGLNERVANDPMQVRTRLTGGSVGVRITTTTTDTRGANRGVIRHQVFGHNDRWVSQPYARAKGYFDNTIAAGAPKIQKALLGVMSKVAIELTRRIG